MFSERTNVGLDVHARSVVASRIDGVTGEVFRSRLTPAHKEIIGPRIELFVDANGGYAVGQAE